MSGAGGGARCIWLGRGERAGRAGEIRGAPWPRRTGLRQDVPKSRPPPQWNGLTLNYLKG